MTGVGQLPHADKIMLQTMYVGSPLDCEVSICEYSVAHDLPVCIIPKRNISSFRDRLEIPKVVKYASHVQWAGTVDQPFFILLLSIERLNENETVSFGTQTDLDSMDIDTLEIALTGLGFHACFRLGVGRLFFFIEGEYPKDKFASSIQHFKLALNAGEDFTDIV